MLRSASASKSAYPDVPDREALVPIICAGLGEVHAASFSKRARISSTRQTVTLRLNLIGCGKRAERTPAHQVLFETGIGPSGAKMDDNRTKPAAGSA